MLNEINNIKIELNKLMDEISQIQRNLSGDIFKAKNITILKVEETLGKLIENENLSMARFGDGEVRLMLKDDFNIGFQKNSKELASQLKKVFISKKANCLICLASNYTYGFRNNFWKKVVEETQYELSKLISDNSVFGNTGVTRNAKLVPMFKEIWADKKIVIVEGELSRLGVGNDLFSNVTSIKRILCPAINAFEKHDEILNEILKQGKENLILLALGPTATILSYELSNLGYRALDIGHLDIVYEWKLRGAKNKIAVPGKYVNEVKDGGKNIIECNDINYLNQIVSRIV